MASALRSQCQLIVYTDSMDMFISDMRFVRLQRGKLYGFESKTSDISYGCNEQNILLSSNNLHIHHT